MCIGVGFPSLSSSVVNSGIMVSSCQLAICICYYFILVGWGGTLVQQHSWTHTCIATHNLNIEGDQEHQHVWWAPADNVSATFPWHCSCVTSLPQCHSSSVRMLCLGWGWRGVCVCVCGVGGWRGSAAGIGPLQMRWLIKGSSIKVIEMNPPSLP